MTYSGATWYNYTIQRKGGGYSIQKVIDAVIVDTSAFAKEQCDFLGMYSSMLPSFFQALEFQGVALLSHHIIFEETIRRIGESEILVRLSNLKKSVGKYKDILPLVGVSPEEVTHKIDTLELESKMRRAFEQAYENAVVLPYPDPQDIFNLYFHDQPPFAKSGKKRHEFPDAFVIESVKEYRFEDRNTITLVISDDPDWKATFDGAHSILFADSLSEGMKILQANENLIHVLEVLSAEVDDVVQNLALSEGYELYPYSDVGDFEITDISVESTYSDIIPLSIAEGSATFIIGCSLEVSGSTTIRDEANSFWDKEDGEYLFESFLDISFQGGRADVRCEISVNFDHNDPVGTAILKSAKLITHGNIEVSIDESDIM